MRRSKGILLGLVVVGVVLLAMPATALGDVSWQYPCSGDVYRGLHARDSPRSTTRE